MPKNKTALRKTFLLDAPMQLSVPLTVVGLLLAMTLLYVAAYPLFVEDSSPLGELTSRRAQQLGILVNGVYFLLVLVGVIVVGVVSTHRIAGPALVIERAIRALKEDDLDGRLDLRERDHLKSLATAVSELRESLRERRETRRLLLDELEKAMGSGAFEHADELIAELRCRPTGEEPPRGAQDDVRLSA